MNTDNLLHFNITKPLVPTQRVVAKVTAPQEARAQRDSDILLVGKVSLTKECIPAVVRTFVTVCNRYGDSALSGGSIIDLGLKNNPNDYDVFTTMPLASALSLLEEVEAEQVHQLTPEGKDMQPEYSGPVQYVLEFFLPDLDEPVQLIGVNTRTVWEHVAQQFCVGISRAMWKPSGFSACHSFLRDTFKQTITVKNPDTLTYAYMKKLITKFIDWEFRYE